MLLEGIDGKWKSISVNACCDECGTNYKAKISTALRQEKLVGHHQCRRCSSRRAGKKTAEKMSEVYSRLYSGEGNFSKKPGVSEKISKALKGRKFSEERKQGLRKKKNITEKFLNAMQEPALRENRSKRMKEKNPTEDPKVREKISETVTALYQSGKCHSFKKFKTGWMETDKTKSPIWCRSGLEKDFLKKASKCEDVEQIESAEKIRISYEFNGSKHNYLPDFKVVMKNGINIIVEVKGSYFMNLPNWESKRLALVEFCGKLGICYLVITEKEIDQWLDKLKELTRPQVTGLGT